MRTLLGAAGVLAVLAAVGCGSSGGGDEPAPSASKGLQTVEIGNISAAPANEGEQVTVTLPVTNSTGNALSYDWTVTFDGQPITFSGQNTNTIRFTAPQVDGDRSVQVSVELDLVGGDLVGRNEVYSSVRIIDSNPNRVNQVAGDAFLNKGAEVTEFDLSALPDSASWRYTLYGYEEISLDGQIMPVHQALTGVGHTTAGIIEDFEWQYCGGLIQFVSIKDMVEEAITAGPNCEIEELSIKRFQDENSLFSEFYCGAELVGTNAFQFIATGVDSYTRATFSVDGGAEYIDENACVEFTRYAVVDDSGESGMFTKVIAYGELESESYAAEITIGGDNFGSTLQFFSASSLDELNTFSMDWKALGDFSGLAQDFGTYTIESADRSGSYNAEFDMRLSKGTFDNLNIEGSIEVSLP